MHTAQPLVSLEGICKSFGPVKANNNISLNFYPGRIKALLGENGAGKSTLMSMLAGSLQPDAGTIRVHGNPVRFTSPRHAHNAGIGMVYQHFKLVDSMTVAENVMLGQEDGFLLHPAKMCASIAVLARTYGIEIDPAARVEDLSMGERQRVEILKLLRRESSVLIFDEPTAVLTPKETEQLFYAFQRMAALEKSIVFISHKLQEVMEIADEIAILRRGEVVEEFDRESVPDKTTLASRMIGRSMNTEIQRPALAPGEEVMVVENLEVKGLQPLSFTLRKSEVLAIAGVAGNGQKELVEVLAGLCAPQQGNVRLLGNSWKEFFPTPPKVNGLAYIPEDRQGMATCPDLTLVDNLLLTSREIFTEGMLLQRSAGLAATLQIITQYDVRPGNPQASGRSLSGGNLQKLVIGRELLRQPAVIIAENPTQGLDIAATEDVWARLLEARQHAGILLVTGDVNEALQLADRIAVMYRGKFVDCFPVSDAVKVSQIGSMMAGVAYR